MVTDLDGGRRFFRGGNVVAGPPSVHAALQGAVAHHASEAEIDRLNPIHPPSSVLVPVG